MPTETKLPPIDPTGGKAMRRANVLLTRFARQLQDELEDAELQRWVCDSLAAGCPYLNVEEAPE